MGVRPILSILVFAMGALTVSSARAEPQASFDDLLAGQPRQEQVDRDLLGGSGGKQPAFVEPTPGEPITWRDIITAANGTMNDWVELRQGSTGRPFSGSGHIVDALNDRIDVDLSGGNSRNDMRVVGLPPATVRPLKRGQAVTFECSMLDLSITMPDRRPSALCRRGKIVSTEY